MPKFVSSDSLRSNHFRRLFRLFEAFRVLVAPNSGERKKRKEQGGGGEERRGKKKKERLPENATSLENAPLALKFG